MAISTMRLTWLQANQFRRKSNSQWKRLYLDQSIKNTIGTKTPPMCSSLTKCQPLRCLKMLMSNLVNIQSPWLTRIRQLRLNWRIRLCQNNLQSKWLPRKLSLSWRKLSRMLTGWASRREVKQSSLPLPHLSLRLASKHPLTQHLTRTRRTGTI